MDWEERAISELHRRFEAIYRCIDKIAFPGLCGVLPDHRNCSPTLRSGIAFLTGGVDRFGAPIIYLPYNQNLLDFTKSDFQGVIQYLAAVTKASAADVGFVLLIDRRRDRWTSLSLALQNVASCFPGELRMIFVLRPSSVIHGVLSSIAMRWQKDDLNYKVPMEVVSSAEVLSPWIDKTDIPEELGGLHTYDHQTWLTKRKLIEKLASSLKYIIEHCKLYSLELINVQFSNEEKLVETAEKQDEEFNCFLEKIDAILQEGKNVLQNEIWNQEKSDSETVNVNKADIKHLCSLIFEVKDAFLEFWEIYNSKRTEYVHLRTFEQDYKTAASHISSLICSLEKEMVEEEKMISYENFLDEEMTNKNQAHENLDLCLRTRTTGENLIEEHPHAIDCIKPKCDELKRLSGCFYGLLTEKRQREESLLRIRKDIKEVNDWCSIGMKLLAKQNLNDVRTSIGVNNALQAITEFRSSNRSKDIFEKRSFLSASVGENKIESKALKETMSNFDALLELIQQRQLSLNEFPGRTSEKNPLEQDTKHGEHSLNREKFLQIKILSSNSSPNTAVVHPLLHSDISPIDDNNHKLRHVIKELLETEKKYVEELTEIVQGYGRAIDDPSMVDFVPAELKGNKAILLGNMEEILQFHKVHLLPDIIQRQYDITAISDLFVKKKAEFLLYCDYCHNSHRSKLFRREIGENHPFFVECQSRLSHRLPLSAYLLKPVQRITKYQLLLQQMHKYSPEDNANSLTTAIETMMEVLKQLNDSMHQISIRGLKEEFSTLGKLFLQGSFQVQVEYKKPKVKDLARSKFNKPLARHLFLYENALLICKKCQTCEGSETEKESGGKSGPRAGKRQETNNSYQFKRCIKTNMIVLTDTVKGFLCKFKLSSRGDDVALIIIASSATIKQNWIKCLQGCISRQKKINMASNSSPKAQTRKKKVAEGPLKQSVSRDSPKNNFRTSKETNVRKSASGNRRVNENKPIKSSKKPTKVKDRKDNSSDEVNFGNIHGVDASPSKFKGSAEIHQERLCKQISDTPFHKSYREKKLKLIKQ